MYDIILAQYQSQNTDKLLTTVKQSHSLNVGKVSFQTMFDF